MTSIPTKKSHVETRSLIRCCSKSVYSNYTCDQIYLPGDAFHIESVMLSSTIGSRSLEKKFMASFCIDLEYQELSRAAHRKRIMFPASSIYNKQLNIDLNVFSGCSGGTYLMIHEYFNRMDYKVPRVPEKKPEKTAEELESERIKKLRKNNIRALEIDIPVKDREEEEQKQQAEPGTPLVEIPDILKEFNEYDGLKQIDFMIFGYGIDLCRDEHGRTVPIPM